MNTPKRPYSFASRAIWTESGRPRIVSGLPTNQTERKVNAAASGSIYVAVCLAGVEYVRFRS